MNNIFPLLAAAAPSVETATNATAAATITKSTGALAERISASTGIPTTLVGWAGLLIAAFSVLIIGYWIASFVRSFIRRVCERRSLDATVSGFVGNLAHTALMLFVIITALGVLGVPTNSFSALVAAAGLAIGLALQGSLANFASGFLLVVFRPFKKGDIINAGGVEGIVDEISIFSTGIVSPDNKRVIVPNSAIMGGTITNHTANDTRRVDLQFGVAGDCDLATASKALVSAAVADRRVLKAPAPAVANVKMIDGGTLVELRAWCKTADYADLSSDFIAVLPKSLGAAGIKGPDKTIAYREVR